MNGELVPEPDVKHGTRVNQAYREQFLDQLALAYAENVISSSERDARAAVSMREGVTIDELRLLTRDLPGQAQPELVSHPPARTRVMLYILAGAASFTLMVGGPTAAASIHGAHLAGWLLPALAVVTLIMGVGALAATVFAAFTDKVVLKEYDT